MEEINICLALNNDYAPSCAQVMVSVIKNSSDCKNIKFHILNFDLSQSNIKKLARIHKYVNFIKIDIDEFAPCYIPKDAHFSKEAYLRLKIPYVLPNVDKAVYLDCDLTFCADIKNFFKINISDYFLAAIKNNGSNDTYFNSGVMLINCKKWREGIDFGSLISTASKMGEKLKFVDQDLLNEVFLKKALLVDKRWNLQYTPSLHGRKKPPEIKKEIMGGDFFVIHYLTNHKPWQKVHHEYRNLFLHYLSLTPYKGYYLKNILKNLFW